MTYKPGMKSDTSAAEYAEFLAKEYGITDRDEIAAIALQIESDERRHEELRAMSEGFV